MKRTCGTRGIRGVRRIHVTHDSHNTGRASRAALVAALLLFAATAHSQHRPGSIGADLLIPEATVPPAGTLRAAVRLTPAFAYSFFSTETGRTTLTEQLGGTMVTTSVGLEAMYVVTPGIAVFASWVPGATPLSTFSADQNRLALGVSPVHLGWWVTIAGRHGLVDGIGREGSGGESSGRDSNGREGGASTWARLLDSLETGVALVVAIPMPWPDYEVQLDRLNQGATYVAENSGIRAFGAGYLIRSHWQPPGSPFALAAAHDLLFFFPAPYDSAGLKEFEENRIWEAISSTERIDTIRYRYQIGASIEPRYHLTNAVGSRWRLGLPISFRYRPEPMFDGNIAVKNTQEWHLNAGVSVSIVPAGLSRHWEFVMDYQAPVAGTNVRAEHRFGLSAVMDVISRSRR